MSANFYASIHMIGKLKTNLTLTCKKAAPIHRSKKAHFHFPDDHNLQRSLFRNCSFYWDTNSLKEHRHCAAAAVGLQRMNYTGNTHKSHTMLQQKHCFFHCGLQNSYPFQRSIPNKT